MPGSAVMGSRRTRKAPPSAMGVLETPRTFAERPMNPAAKEGAAFGPGASPWRWNRMPKKEWERMFHVKHPARKSARFLPQASPQAAPLSLAFRSFARDVSDVPPKRTDVSRETFRRAARPPTLPVRPRGWERCDRGPPQSRRRATRRPRLRRAQAACGCAPARRPGKARWSRVRSARPRGSPRG